MDELKVFVCIQENDGVIEIVDWIIASDIEEVMEQYPQHDLIEEVPIELILKDIKELTKEE